MSGFAGVFHLDGAPVERAWLEKMAAFLAFRGPDRSQIWINGNAGLCHTLLRTRAEHDNHPQIASLDGKVWITGDIRIDDRETLFSKLSVPNEIVKAADSAELVLHAYAQWGEACVEHLLGDFSFVVWDSQRQRIFGARDQLGVTTFFFARLGKLLIVSNVLDCIRQVPLISAELDDEAVGDFLIVGSSLNPASTFFTAIRRLPAAHRLIVAEALFRNERYWTLPFDQPLYYKRATDYIDQFRLLLRDAVKDRLSDGPLGVFMSGGLDSPAVAATAKDLGNIPTAFTSIYERRIDDEKYYSGLVAQHLGISIIYDIRDDEPWGWEPNSDFIHTPEPTHDVLHLVANRRYHTQISRDFRTFFYGDGPDAALRNEWQSHLSHLIRRRRWVRLSRDLAFHFAAHRRIPLLPTLPRMWRERRSNQPDWYDESVPTWLNPEFKTGLKLSTRPLNRKLDSPGAVRPIAYSSFVGDFPMGGGGNDAIFQWAPREHLHPLVDLRLVRYLLAVPVIPWCRDKYLIRRALKGILPESILRRPKAPVRGFPYLERARKEQQPELPPLAALNKYVDLSGVPKWPGRNRKEFDQSLRVLALHYWLLTL